jgi:Tol biopolymer transport system component
MTRSRCTAVAVVVAAAALAAVASADSIARSSPRWPAPKTLLSVRFAEGFAQDGNRIVWADSSQPCRRFVQLRNLATKVTTPLLGVTGPTCELSRATGGGGFQWRMALAGTRALWGYVYPSLSAEHTQLATAAPGKPERALGWVHLDKDNPYRPVPMAGDGNTLVFAHIGDAEGQDPQGVFRVPARPSAPVRDEGCCAATPVPGTQGASAVAAAGARFAISRYEPGGCVCNDRPVWSPNGEAIAFEGRPKRGPYGVYVVDVATRETRTIADDASLIGWTSDGAGVIVGGFDGVAVVSLGGVRRVVTTATFAGMLSPDHKLLAYVVAVGDNSELHVVSVANGEDVTLAREAGSTNVLTWSPASDELVYSVFASSDVLRRVSVAGGPPVTLATGAGLQASWSPTGARLAIAQGSILSVLEADNSEHRIAGDVDGTLVGWSPDGTWLAYWRLSGGAYELRLARPDGTENHGVATVKGRFPWVLPRPWSPSSTALLVATSSTPPAIFVAPVDGSGARRIATGSSPAWSPDGRSIAFSAPTSSVAQLGEISVMDAVGANLRALTRTEVEKEVSHVELRAWRTGARVARFDVNALVSALALDGGRIATLSWHPGGGEIIVRRASGGKVLARATVPRSVDPELSMSGRWIVFRSGKTIRILDANTRKASVLTVAKGTVIGLSIDGRRVAWGEQLLGRRDRIRAIVLITR